MMEKEIETFTIKVETERRECLKVYNVNPFSSSSSILAGDSLNLLVIPSSPSSILPPRDPLIPLFHPAWRSLFADRSKLDQIDIIFSPYLSSKKIS